VSASTIAAVSSPPGPGRRGVLRLSGPRAREIVNVVFASDVGALEASTARCVRAGRLDDGTGTQPARLLWMPGPHSYTREDVAELHVPGSPPLVARALARLLECGAEAARPGEFTRRAFLNGRIDLTRAEGVLELVQATSEAERRAAVHLLGGGLDRRVRPLRDRLDETRALLEASLDFDETDTGHVPAAELARGLADVARRLDEALSWEVARQPPSALPRVVLFGAPNAGKSSLFNRLAAGRALVSDLAGTTRDSLRALWNPDDPERSGGSALLLVDSPGLDSRVRTGPDASAQHLAAREWASAELVLWVVDAANATAGDLERQLADAPPEAPILCAWNQIDRSEASGSPAGDVAELFDRRGVLALPVSARTGEGLGELAARVAARFRAAGPGADGGEEAGVGRELFARHRRALEEAAEELARARAALDSGVPLDLVAETLRGATQALDGIEGRTTPEDLLDRIFARFCLGK